MYAIKHNVLYLWLSMLNLTKAKQKYVKCSLIIQQEADWPHRFPEKPVQINKHLYSYSYDYIITLKPSISFRIIEGSLFVKPWVPFTLGCVVTSLLEMTLLFRRRFLNLSNVVFFLWKMAGSFIWTNLNPLYQMMLCAKVTSLVKLY